MQAKLLPLDENVDNLIDYTKGVITRYYEYNGAKYYFSLFPEISGMPGQSLSGRYLAIVASTKGLDHFFIESDGEGNYHIDTSDSDIVDVESANREAPAPIMEIVKEDAAAELVEVIPTINDFSTTPVIKMPLPSPSIDMVIDEPESGKPTSEYDGIYDDDPSPFLGYRPFDEESGILIIMSIAIAQWKEAN